MRSFSLYTKNVPLQNFIPFNLLNSFNQINNKSCQSICKYSLLSAIKNFFESLTERSLQNLEMCTVVVSGSEILNSETRRQDLGGVGIGSSQSLISDEML